MSKSLDLNAVIQCVKNIVDNNQCIVCDKLEGGRGRYPCGHTGCNDCLSSSDACLLCLTPPNPSGKASVDKPLTEQVEHALDLLRNCQDAFNIDVFKRQRISEQLKVEKEVFPECIQAPVKYYNKRKSFALLNNKENQVSLFYPGEGVSPSKAIKMDKRKTYVQNWLNGSEQFSRKAFTDLIVNQQSIGNQNVLCHDKTDKFGNNYQNFDKRKIDKSFSLIGKQKVNLHVDNISRKRKSQVCKENFNNRKHAKAENDESGIVIDDYEPDIICIEESPSQTLDKDKLALLAVEAANNEYSALSLESLECTQVIDINIEENNTVKDSEKNKFAKDVSISKVPFYKKGYLRELCKTCESNTRPGEYKQVQTDSNTVSISIENKEFVTTVNIKNIACSNYVKKNFGVQTDLGEQRVTSSCEKVLILHPFKEKYNIRSHDFFLDDLKCKDNSMRHNHNATLDIPSKDKERTIMKKNLVIEESDTDSIEETQVLSVTADVHRPCEPVDYGILNKLDVKKLGCKRKKNRGATPDSSNSSNKENCDPNRKKRRKNLKKKLYKK